jgi:hypothetical protein
MGQRSPRALTLDSGALIALESRDTRVALLLRTAIRTGTTLVVPAGVLAQVWRDGSRQTRLAALIGSNAVVVESLSSPFARLAGELCDRRGTSDVIDASVVLTARRFGGRVVTSDPGDLHRLEPSLETIAI